MVALMTNRGISQSEIAVALGLSRQRVGQMLDKAEEAGIPTTRRQAKKMSKCRTCDREIPRGRKFCSKECVPQRKLGGRSSNIEVILLECSGCGARFSRTKRLQYIANKTAERRGKSSERRFCTRECYLKNGLNG